MRPDLDNVQSFFVARYRHRYRVVLLFRIDNPAAAQRFLQKWASGVNGGLAPDVSTSAGSDNIPEPVYHFAFNWAGTALLLKERSAADDGLDPDQVGTHLEAFFIKEENAPHSKTVTGSLDLKGINAPENWWADDSDPAAFHIAMLCYFGSENQKAEGLAAIRADASDHALHEWQMPSFEDNALSGTIPDGGMLHFGFRDGISKVDIDWDDAGTPGKSNFREVLLGYYSDDYKVSPFHAGPWRDFVRDGTYVNLAWLYQDVAAFNRFLKDNRAAAAAESGAADPDEWLAAKMMGRWRDGSALAVHPDNKPAQWDPANDFGYGDDPKGERTPLFSHIRVCNPRDDELTFPNQRRFKKGPPRLVRRGFSYGPPLQGDQDDGKDRGLVGVFSCARINEQFHTVIRWINQTDFSEPLHTIPRGSERQDMMFGHREKQDAETTTHIHASNATDPALELPLKDFIRYKGLAVFFAPGLSSLSYLSGT